VPWAVLVKDLRTASRTPGFAFLILLPLLDALAIGLWTYSSNTTSANAFSLGSGAVATAALLATFFGPAFFAIEVMGYSYTRTLPIAQRSLLAGKIALIALLYLVSATVVLGVTIVKVDQPVVFLAFIAAEFPAVLGAAMTELGLLFIVARRRGLPIVNLYTGAWWLTLVAIPGVLLAGIPLVLYWVLSVGNPVNALYVMALVGLAEFALGLGFALGPATREGA
jgi:predicted permease